MCRGSSSLLLFTDVCRVLSNQKELRHSIFLLIAEIAQLVEHNLAKVGVASSSLVFRSTSFSSCANHIRIAAIFYLKSKAFVIEGLCDLKTTSSKLLNYKPFITIIYYLLQK